MLVVAAVEGSLWWLGWKERWVGRQAREGKGGVSKDLNGNQWKEHALTHN